jgi:hypothetical protein
LEFHLTFVSGSFQGNGVYQKGINFALDRLADGQWVHIFPEGVIHFAFSLLFCDSVLKFSVIFSGHVNETGKICRLKWGRLTLGKCKHSSLTNKIDWH